MRISVVIPAAGKGRRAGFSENKIFHLLPDGRTVLERAASAFFPFADEVIIAADPAEEGRVRALFGARVRVVTGGKTRTESVRRALEAATGEIVLVHDAARPFVSASVITAALEAAARCGAAAPAVPVKDTIKAAVRGSGKTVPESCFVHATPDRSTLYAVQTPQCFDRAAYLAALEELDAKKARLVTDDCSLFELTGRPVQLTQGDYANLKITTREDLPRPEQKEEHKMRIGHGYDVHRLVEGRKLILGGVEIPFEKGLLGHSDADVLAHAVMDAVLGAAALAFIVLYNLTNINITEREREIATIKVLGFYDGETNRYVFRENIILTVLGALVGLPMGKLLHAYVMGQIKIDLMCFDVRVAPLSYLISAALTLVFGLLVNLALRRKIRTIDMSQALKSIE